MRDGIRTVIVGAVMAFGMAWSLLEMFLLGCLLLASSAPRTLSGFGAAVGIAAGLTVWACGVALLVELVVSVMRGSYGVALCAVSVPAIGIAAASWGPAVATAIGPVPMVGFAVAIACSVVLVTSAIASVLHLKRSGAARTRRQLNSRWRAPIRV